MFLSYLADRTKDKISDLSIIGNIADGPVGAGVLGRLGCLLHWLMMNVKVFKISKFYFIL